MPQPRRPDPEVFTRLWRVDEAVIPDWVAQIILAKADQGDEQALRIKQHLIRPDGTRVVDET